MLSELWNSFRNRSMSFSAAGIAALVIAGLVFLIWPRTAMSLICRLLGVVLLVYGIILILRYFNQKERARGYGYLILTIILIIFGALITANPFFLVRISGTLLALFFLGYGAFSLFRLIRVDGPRGGRWIFCMAGAVFELIMGILLLAAPVSASAVVLRIVGVVFLYAALSALYYRTRLQTGEGSPETFTETDINGKEIIEGTAREVTEDNDTAGR